LKKMTQKAVMPESTPTACRVSLGPSFSSIRIAALRGRPPEVISALTPGRPHRRAGLAAYRPAATHPPTRAGSASAAAVASSEPAERKRDISFTDAILHTWIYS
jgi:hypothetical protein